MFRLWRYAQICQVRRWGLLFLLGVTAMWAVDAAEAKAEPQVRPEGAPPVPRLQEQAIEQLEELGQQMRASAAATLELIGSTTAPVELRRRAALALATIGLENQEQALVLFRILADPRADLELRRTLLMAFGEKESFAPLLLPALLQIVKMKGDESMLRREALFALRRFASQEAILPALTAPLADPDDDTDMRLAVLDHLRMFAAKPEAAIEVLSAIMRDRREPTVLRERTIDTLRGLGARGRPAAAALVALLSDPEEETSLRLAAAQALRQTGWPESESTPLARLLFHAETPSPLRTMLAELTVRLDDLPPLPASQWLPVLEDPKAPTAARRLAARMLASADLGLPDGVALSARLLQDNDEDLQVRRAAGEFLRRSGMRAAPARETLENILLNENTPAELREVASTALTQVAQMWVDRPAQLDRVALNRHLAAIDHTVNIMEQAGLQTPPHPQNLESVRRLRDMLHAEKASRWTSRFGDWAETHPAQARWIGAMLVLALAGFFLTLAWWAMIWIAPLRLGEFDARLRRYEVALPRALGGHALGLRHLGLVAWWAGHERVLEAWTRLLRSQFVIPLPEQEGRGAAGISLDLPVSVDGVLHDTCPFDLILDKLTQQGMCLSIAGEAGTGKSTLAAQIACRASAPPLATGRSRASVLPIWIDRPLPGAPEGLLERLHQQFNSMPPDAKRPPPQVLQALFLRGRILLIVDGLSEWSAGERDDLIKALVALRDTPAIITARNAFFVAGRNTIRLDVPRLAGPYLARFMENFLERSPSGTGIDVLEACGYWTDLTAGRGTPADGARIYAEFLLMERGLPAGTGRPENVLELVRAYVTQRNRRIENNRMPDHHVLQIAAHLAWVCAQHDGAVPRSRLPKSLPPQDIDYLEKKLALIRIDPRRDHIRFLQQTVADYLAAGHLIEAYGREDETWRRRELSFPGVDPLAGSSLAAIPGNLAEPLWNACYQWSDPFAPAPIPDWLLNDIEHRLDATADSSSRSNPRLRQLVRLVLAPENPERHAAVEALAALGAAASPAVPTLLSAFQKAGEDLEVRHAVLTVLALLGGHAHSAAPALRLAIQHRGEHLFLRIKAIDALLAVGASEPASLQLLIDKSTDSAESTLLRNRAAQALSELNTTGSGAVSVPQSGSKM